MYKTLPTTREQKSYGFFQTSNTSFYSHPQIHRQNRNHLTSWIDTVGRGILQDLRSHERILHQTSRSVSWFHAEMLWPFYWNEETHLIWLLDLEIKIFSVTSDISWWHDRDHQTISDFYQDSPRFCCDATVAIPRCCVWGRCCHFTSVSRLMSGKISSRKRSSC